MTIQKTIFFVVLLLCLTGCSHLGFNGFGNRGDQNEPVDISGFLNFASDLVVMDTSEQLKTCLRIADEDIDQQQISSRLRHAVSIILIADCGSHSQALDILNDLVDDVEDEQLEQVVTVLSVLLEQTVQSEKKLRNQLVSLSRKATQLRKNLDTARVELDTLQTKLEELKSIEQNLNKR